MTTRPAGVRPRGPVSAAVADVLSGASLDLEVLEVPAGPVLEDDDAQLALWMLYRLHYDTGSDPALEWDPRLVGLRRRLEDALLADLRSRTEDVVDGARGDDDLPSRLFEMVDSFEGPGVASHLQRDATAEQFAEYLVHRSVYNLRETDPQMFAFPRLPGRAQVAMVELAYDEYGAGRPDRRHSLLFARAMEACGLESGEAAYVDLAPPTSLAVVNVMHLFALRRELVAASVGHFGAFEASSSGPCRQVSSAAERLGLGEAVCDYFDEHVVADAVHEQLAFRDACTALVAEDPAAEELVLLGAATCLVVEAVAATTILDAWSNGRSSLRGPLPGKGPAS